MSVAPRAMRHADRRFLDDLVARASGDDRVCALFLGGSHASGTADDHSDLDLYLITYDDAFDSFRAERRAFMSSLGDAVFLEEHEQFGFLMLLYMFDRGVHGEIAIAPAADLATIHSGPYIPLLDEDGILEDRDFAATRLDESERTSIVRRLLVWFWYDRRLLEVALARGQLWTAHFYLERCRVACVDLARLRDRPDTWPGGYEKCEGVVGDGALDALAASVVPLARHEMRKAAGIVTEYYLEVGREVAGRDGVEFPERLADLVQAD